jgi:hypothetical protein
MLEQQPSPERKVEREEVLGALKTNGKEHPETMQLLTSYIEQRRKEVEQIKEKEAHYRASIECSIDNALLFHEAGFTQEAVADLEDTLEIAYNAQQDDLCERIVQLINDMNNLIE